MPDHPSPNQAAGESRSALAGVLPIVLPYVAFAAGWIYLSDWVVERLAGDTATSARWSTIKGLLFVVVTAALLWGLLVRWMRRELAVQAALDRERTLLRTVIDTIPDLIWLKDTDGRYVAGNRAFARFMGTAEPEMIGKDDYAFFPRELADFFRRHDANAAAAGRPTVNAERVTYRSDGTVHDLETIKTPLPDGRGGIAGVLGIARDVTEALATAEALKRTQRQFALALEAAQIGTWRHDTATGIITHDSRSREHYDVDASEMRVEDIPSRVHGDDPKRVRALIGEVIAGRVESISTIQRMLRRDGSERWLSLRVQVDFEGEGPARRPVVVYGMTRDVTDMHRAEEQLRQQEALLQQAGTIAQVGGWQMDVVTGQGSWSEEVARIHDVDPAAATSKDFGLAFYQGESRARIEAAVKAAIERGEPYDLELELMSAKGVRKWVRTIGHPVVENGRVVRLSGAIQDVTRRKTTEDAVQRFVSGSPAMIYAADARDWRIVWAGGNVEKITGWSERDVTDAWWREHIHRDDRERVLAAVPAPYEIDHQVLEYRFQRRDGRYVWVRDEMRLLRDARGAPSEVVGSWTDVTERVTLEEQFRQSQKLEAIGRLAGGVAHDFNNILTVIGGNADLLSTSLKPGSVERALLGEIRDAGDRAAALTRQLLAFSRRQVLAPEVVSVNTAVQRMESMLRRLIGEDIDLRCVLSPDAGNVRVDPGQFEQVILNLAVNARDAMPHGGRLSIETRGVVLDEEFCRQRPGISPGPHARLVIADTGAGMTPDVKARVFEPFFTTKGPGAGTGLGLATVFGIVKQSGGHVEVESESGAGSRFTIVLPKAPEGAAETPAPAAPDETAGHETVLLVEDEEGVRKVARHALESRGYRVLGAADGRAALSLFEVHRDEVAVLVTDLVMPNMSGRELADLMRRRRPDLKVLFMSGYVEDARVREGLGAESEVFIQKPFVLADFARRVRDVLDGRT